MSDSDQSTQPNDIQKMFEEFQNTRFYQWLDGIITGRFRWLILPITGIVDAFVIVIPTELIIAMYMMRNSRAVWWIQTGITAVFAGLGYVILALIVSQFGIDAVSWLGVVTGEEIAQAVDDKLSEHIVLFAASAGITSIFPMPMTAFAVMAGLFGWPLALLFVGAFIGKFARFGIFAYGARRWGNDALHYYFTHANKMSLVLVVLIIMYLVIKHLTVQ